MRQFTLSITEVDADHVQIECDGVRDTVPVSEIFSTEVSDAMIIHSICTRCAIENKPNPAAKSVLDAIAASGGVQTPARPVFVQRIEYDESTDTYVVTYGFRADDASYGLSFPRERLDVRENSATAFAWQVGAFLRFKGHRSLTAQAMAAIRTQKFWGA